MNIIMKSFEELGRSAGTDKVTHHGYQRFYPRYLESLRSTATGMLEIGIYARNSIFLWKEYFEKAQIYGIDIKHNTSTDARVTMFQADQSKAADLEKVIADTDHPIQFIIDDGSHIPEHQVLSFDLLFDKLLQPGGVYIVEDIETSYWVRGEISGYPTRYGFNHSNSFIERAKLIIDKINCEFMSPELDKHNVKQLHGFSEQTLNMIATMTFGQNCVIFTKKSIEDMRYNNRSYRFARCSHI